MTPRKKWLIIGGSALGVLALLCVIGFLFITITGRGSYALSAPVQSREAWVDDGYADGAAPMVVAPAAPPEPMLAATMPAAGGGGPGYNTGAVQQVQRLIIRNGNISIVVENTEKAIDDITALVKSMEGEGAFVVSVNTYEGGYYPEGDRPALYANMAIRVPATRFDEVMERLADMAVSVTNRSESGEDVTEEYVDLSARLESMEAARQRLLEIMQNAATTEELLQAEAQLTQREAEIEGIKGRMQYLEGAARLSSIYIDISPYILSQPVDTRWRPAETFRRAINDLIDGLKGFGNFLIYFTIAVLPWLALAGAVIYGIVRFIIWRVRRGRAKREAQAAAGAPEEYVES